MNSIKWPNKFLPGLTDNFASNEVIVKDLDIEKVWKYLSDTKYWTKYYENCSNIIIKNEENTQLHNGTRFSFETFGFDVEAEVMEYTSPSDGQVGRLAWHGWNNEKGDKFLDVWHAWLIEKLDFNRVRILTQESQIGTPAKEMYFTNPNTMDNGHQDWLQSLVKYTQTH